MDFLSGFAEVPRRSKAANAGSPLGVPNGLRLEVPFSFSFGLDSTKDIGYICRACNDSADLSVNFVLNGLSHANKLLGYRVFDTEEWSVVREWSDGSWIQNPVLLANIESLKTFASRVEEGSL